MPKPIELQLSDAEGEQLERIRDYHPKPYFRERAAALLKIAAGQSGRDVAQNGLHKRRKEDTLSAWVSRYRTDGIKGIEIKAGRGRGPPFFPQHKTADSAHPEIQHTLGRDPHQLGGSQSRWTLSAIREVCDWLKNHTPSGVWRTLRQLKIHLKRGRD
ncbi:MAG: hypothetical protein O7E52_09615 [Candidatus Poribacteria bacterium]|nr:hypothetical protein [Candidatus Poribacteria bacterium]